VYCILDNAVLAQFIQTVYTILLREGIYPTYSQHPYTPNIWTTLRC